MAIPFPFTTPVRGVSNYAAAVEQTRVGDRAVIRHEPDNPYDANACAIVVRDELVGYLPASLAARLTAGGNAWQGHISERLDGAHPGLRVTVTGPADEVDASNTADQETVDRSDVATVTIPAPRSPVQVVRARSGRVLGTMVTHQGDRVVVATARGEVPYPADLVVVEQ